MCNNLCILFTKTAITGKMVLEPGALDTPPPPPPSFSLAEILLLLLLLRKNALSRPRIEGNPFQADMDVSEF